MRIFTLTWFQLYYNLGKRRYTAVSLIIILRPGLNLNPLLCKERGHNCIPKRFLVHLKVLFRKNKITKKKRDDFNIHITNFPFLSSNIRSSPIAFLYHNSSDTPGLVRLRNVLFWGRCDFPISFSGRDMSNNVWTRLLGRSMVGTDILPSNMRSPSPGFYTTFLIMTICSDNHW